jgi:very-short-patch-repair endonuclease
MVRMPKHIDGQHCYKVDVGNPKYRAAVEIDGPSRFSRKKDTVLRLLGWSVLRFRNEEVLENLPECVRRARSMIPKHAAG